jgi:hypothetical protein
MFLAAREDNKAAFGSVASGSLSEPGTCAGVAHQITRLFLNIREANFVDRLVRR